jgi:hypothetical protein
MNTTNTISTAEAAHDLPDGQWIVDAEGGSYCLIDTHLGFPQRMAMHGRHCKSLESLAYPLGLADFIGECEHRWGSHEMGHCVRCGVIIATPRPMFFDEAQRELFHAAALANDAYDARKKAESND